LEDPTRRVLLIAIGASFVRKRWPGEGLMRSRAFSVGFWMIGIDLVVGALLVAGVAGAALTLRATS